VKWKNLPAAMPGKKQPVSVTSLLPVHHAGLDPASSFLPGFRLEVYPALDAGLCFRLRHWGTTPDKPAGIKGWEVSIMITLKPLPASGGADI